MRTLAIGISMLLPLSLPVFAADQLRPGLWEMRMQSDALRGMQAIPPEQQEQLQRMGITVPTIQNNSLVTKVCIPKEMAERRQVPLIDKQQNGCKVENYQHQGKAYEADIICTGPQMKGKGKVKGNMASAERFESTFDFDGTIEGEPVKHHQTSSGRWLAAECGNVKPLPGMEKRR